MSTRYEQVLHKICTNKLTWHRAGFWIWLRLDWTPVYKGCGHIPINRIWWISLVWVSWAILHLGVVTKPRRWQQAKRLYRQIHRLKIPQYLIIMTCTIQSQRKLFCRSAWERVICIFILFWSSTYSNSLGILEISIDSRGLHSGVYIQRAFC